MSLSTVNSDTPGCRLQEISCPVGRRERDQKNSLDVADVRGPVGCTSGNENGVSNRHVVLIGAEGVPDAAFHHIYRLFTIRMTVEWVGATCLDVTPADRHPRGVSDGT